jgi:hypothetical protein
MSKGRQRVVVRLSDEEMKIAQAAADVVQVDLKQLARMGLLKEAMDVRSRLIEQLKKEKESRENSAGASDISSVVQESESQGIPSTALDEPTQSGNNTGA